MSEDVFLPAENDIEEIAVVGLSGRFPGAKNIEEFWQNLRNGVDSISRFTDKELATSGINSAVLNDPNYVKAKGVLGGIDLFDASFFGFSPWDAEIMDPQHRIFLETAWEALENAGYEATTYPGPIGVFAGASVNDYIFGLSSKLKPEDPADFYQRLIGNEKDFLTTRVSYKLNLKGPSINVQTACSTSLVAVQLACQSLLNYQCSMALAGGVCLMVRQKAGYLYKDGLIISPDGYCRAFDAKGQGTIFGEGVGIVVLKRLSEALANGDNIYAVIKGIAINNDGSVKVGFPAPSVDGQAEVITMAQALSSVDPETISYIEAHGTATPLGDPIEMAALNQAFTAKSNKKGFCAVGSVKTNIGHLDAASGVAGLIKTVLALKHKEIPPSLHFEKPNPNIDFENSPFYVNTKLSEWKVDGFPRRAGVSSFGIGGTNVHAVLEEAPIVEASGKSRPWQLLLLSAQTSTALEKMTINFVDYLNQHPDLNLADVAYTLQVGRKTFDYRRMLVCQNVNDAVSALEAAPQRLLSAHQEKNNPPVVFMFTGQGSQYVNMALELYQTEPVFRDELDRCCEALKPHLRLDLRDILYPGESDTEEAGKQLTQTFITQPVLFTIEYALAKLWMSWGVHPEALVGHSIGEYVAACLAGVFSLEDALSLVAARGRLMQGLPPGSMLSVSLSEQEVQPYLNQSLSLSNINSPSFCVVSGGTQSIEDLKGDLSKKGVDYRPLHTSHAFHSKSMDAILDSFAAHVKGLQTHSPTIPFVSNLTGTWITEEEAGSPDYWAKHLRHTVRFSDCVHELLKEPNRVFLEVGPGRTLSTFVRQHIEGGGERVVLSSVHHPKEERSDTEFILSTLGRLWLAGVQVNWPWFYKNERRHRLPLPTYPFERKRYWIEPEPLVQPLVDCQKKVHKKFDIAEWFYVPSWERSILSLRTASTRLARFNWLVFMDDCGIGPLLIKRLQQDGQDVIAVRIGPKFSKASDNVYTINPREAINYDTLFNELQTRGKNLEMIVNLWGITKSDIEESRFKYCEETQDLGFFSLLNIASAIGRQGITDDIEINFVTNNMQDVTGEDPLYPEKATVLGAVKIIPQEYFNISCRSIDIILPEAGKQQDDTLLDKLLAEFGAKFSDPIIAYRGNYRWVPIMKPVRLDKATETIPPRLREKGVYLITGGFGGMGFILAEYLAKSLKARLILVGRSGFPAREDWKNWLVAHGEQDSVSRKIRKLQELEESGAEVMVFSADVSNYEQMQNVVDLAKKRFYQINGVLHTAGIADYAGMIQKRSRKITETIMAPKVMGTLVLDRVLKDAELDFFILFSSIGNMVYKQKFGQVAYNAANEFLDAFAHYKASTSNTFTVSINWDDWQEVGMMVEAVNKKLAGKKLGNIDNHFAGLIDDLDNGLSPLEGVEVFRRILGLKLSHVAVSTTNLQARINKHTEPEPTKEVEVSPFYSRPALSNVYIAPGNATEQTIAEIWQQLLRIEKVGIHDNFVELGGHSLLAAQVIARLREVFPVELSVASIFENPTVHSMSKMIMERENRPPSFEESKRRGQRRKEIKLQRMTSGIEG
jgi:acyl transferase domain-containing protein/acyl carrier protein